MFRNTCCVSYSRLKKVATIKAERRLFPEMCVVPAAGGAWSPAGLLRRAPLARPAGVLQVCRLRQVSDGPALHGRPGRPLLLSGVQEERRGLTAGAPSWCETRWTGERGRMDGAPPTSIPPILFAYLGLLPVFQQKWIEASRFSPSSSALKTSCSLLLPPWWD